MLYLLPVIQTPVTILGAGPAGATTALALSVRGIPSLLVDAAEFPRDKVCGDALSGKVVLTLGRMDPKLVEELSTSSFALPSHGVLFVAPNGRGLRVPFRRENTGGPPPGYITPRLDFDNWLFQKSSTATGVRTLTGCKIKGFRRVGTEWVLTDESGADRIRTQLIVAADGAHSRFARHFGGIEHQDEHFSAGLRRYYRNVSGLDEQGFIELHFIDDVLPGYFWIFPLAGGRANVGLGMRSDLASKKKLNLKELLDKIIATHPAISPRFSEAEPEEPVRGYGLPLGSLKRKISGDGYLLLGDAASLIDPFTGEGIGNAMISGLKAAETIEACYASSDFTEQSLAGYDQAVYKRLWPELSLSTRMLQLVKYPWLFNLVVNKAIKSKTLQGTISCMFEDIDLRKKLKNPLFYLRILLNG